VKAAIRVREMWRGDVGEEGGASEIQIAIGCTMGFTLPFEPDGRNDEAILEWAQKRDSIARDAEDADSEELEAASEMLNGWDAWDVKIWGG